MRGNITIPVNVEVMLDVERWVSQENTGNFDVVQENITTFVQDALDAWLISKGLGHVER